MDQYNIGYKVDCKTGMDHKNQTGMDHLIKFDVGYWIFDNIGYTKWIAKLEWIIRNN